MRRSLTLPILALSFITVLAGGCSSRSVDLQKAIKLTEVTTGWFDAGIQADRKNKLVPSVSFKLQNADAESVASVQLLGKFQIIGDPEELGSSYIKGIGAEGLPPGQSTGPFVMKSFFGYTGEQARVSMLQHRDFKDAKVEIYGKYRAQNWVRLGEFRISRQLLTE